MILILCQFYGEAERHAKSRHIHPDDWKFVWDVDAIRDYRGSGATVIEFPSAKLRADYLDVIKSIREQGLKTFFRE